jgi:rod shape-determining protein MreD
MMIIGIYLGIGFLLDAIFKSFFSIDYASMRFSIVSHMAFMGLILVVLKQELTKAIILVVVVGLIVDVSLGSFFGLHVFVFLVTMFISRFWSSQINDEFVELLILIVMSVLIKELMIWLMMRISQISSMSLLIWFSQHQVLSLLFNVPLALMMIQLNFLRLRIVARQNFMRKKGESLFLLKLESRTPNDMV